MYINVSLQAVHAAQDTVRAAKALLLANHGNFTTDMESALANWNDANVLKFIGVFGEMTGELNSLLMRLNAIDEFCGEVERMIIAYNS